MAILKDATYVTSNCGRLLSEVMTKMNDSFLSISNDAVN